MTVQIAEEMICEFGGCSVSLPLSNIVAKQCLVRVTCRFFMYLGKVCLQVVFQVLIEIFTKEMCCLQKLIALLINLDSWFYLRDDWPL